LIREVLPECSVAEEALPASVLARRVRLFFLNSDPWFVVVEADSGWVCIEWLQQ